jgi:protein-tyrosine phosphatase
MFKVSVETSMKLRAHFLVALALFSVCLTLVLRTFSSAVAVGIDNPTCELISPGVYRLDYQASPGSGPVQVFASSHADRIDSGKPLLTIRQAPAEVSVPERSGRIYFHLKPASGPTRVVSIRRLPLEGAKNFRDLGGYRSADGRYVRWGLVYRSNYLVDLTPKDFAYLNALGIRLVCDVRSEAERARAPDQWVGNAPEFFSIPIGPNRDGTLTPEELKQRVASLNNESRNSTRGYDKLAVDFAPQFGSILRRLAAGDVPAVEHCSSGKDRTGVFSAILLTALGVPREVVIQDYLLTTRYLLAPDSIEKTTADLQKILGLSEPPDAATVQALMTTKPGTLDATFESLDKTYGSFDSYLQNALKISDSDLAALRQRLLEP